MTTKISTQLKVVHTNLEKLLQAKQAALPINFNQTRFLQNCMTVLQDIKGIENMNPISVARTMLKGAFLGLDFFRKECYAIPYGTELNFQTDYKGEIKLAKKHSLYPIKDIYAKLVREGDVFIEKIVDGQQTIIFNPKPFNNGKVIGAFAVCYYKDGSMIYETMSFDEIEKVRQNYTKGPNSGAWVKSWGEMGKKTVLRRLTKLISVEFDNAEQDQAFDDGGDFQFEEAQYEPIEMPEVIEEEKPKEKTAKKQPEPEPELDMEFGNEFISKKDRLYLFELSGKNEGIVKRALEEMKISTTHEIHQGKEFADICQKIEQFKKDFDNARL